MQTDVSVITIDGPSGSGKGTLARRVAVKLGFHLLDSGALYRLTALACLRSGVSLLDSHAIAMVAKDLDSTFEGDSENHSTRILLAGANVTDHIRAEEVGMAASKVAAYPIVREALLERQRKFCLAPGLVADGRDMGTVVFPNAAVKIFLTASAQERAQRRLLQLEASGVDPKTLAVDQILKDIEARDLQDRTRKVSPLIAAPDAVTLDSTSMSIDDVFDEVLKNVYAKTDVLIAQ